MTTTDRLVPPLRGLTVEQKRGYACVWCAAQLGDTAVDLDPQRCHSLEVPRWWWPRACQRCVSIPTRR